MGGWDKGGCCLQHGATFSGLGDRWAGVGETSEKRACALVAGSMSEEGRGQLILAASWEEKAQTGEPFIGL